MMLSVPSGSQLGPAAWWLALAAGVGYAAALLPGAASALRAAPAGMPIGASPLDGTPARTALAGLPLTALLAGWLAHGGLLLADILGVGRMVEGARLGFGPVLSLTAWLVVAVYLVESRARPRAVVRQALAASGLAGVVLAALFPGEAHLAASRWAPWHWLLGVASYTLFGAAVLHGWMLDRAERALRAPRVGSGLIGSGTIEPPSPLPLLGLERLTFHFVEAGLTVLTLAMALGWASQPARPWTHKTVFSMLAWAVFAALVSGRRLAGWRGRHALRWLYAGATLLLLAYAGSRFVFEVLLGRSSVS